MLSSCQDLQPRLPLAPPKRPPVASAVALAVAPDSVCIGAVPSIAVETGFEVKLADGFGKAIVGVL